MVCSRCVPRSIGSAVVGVVVIVDDDDVPLLILLLLLLLVADDGVAEEEAIRQPVVNKNFNALNSVHSDDRSAIHMDSTNIFTPLLIKEGAPTSSSSSSSSAPSSSSNDEDEPFSPVAAVPFSFSPLILLLPSFKYKSSKHP